MKGLIVLLLLFSLSAKADCIDFWDEGCGASKQLQKQLQKVKKRKQKKQKDKEKLLQELYEKSLNWTPDNLSPLEKYVSLHPEDKKAVYYLRKYLAERQIRACYLERGLALLPTDYCEKMRKLWKNWVEGKRIKTSTTSSPSSTSSKTSTTSNINNYDFLFFFSYTCPHCFKVLPIVLKKLKDYNLIPIPATQENAEKFQEWKVKTVPTLIAYDKKRKKAYRLTGFNEATLEYFLRELDEK